MKIGRAIYWAIGGVQTGVELWGSLCRLVRNVRKGVMPLEEDTEPFPLRHKDAERIAEFGRRAGHENAPKK